MAAVAVALCLVSGKLDCKERFEMLIERWMARMAVFSWILAGGFAVFAAGYDVDGNPLTRDTPFGDVDGTRSTVGHVADFGNGGGGIATNALVLTDAYAKTSDGRRTLTADDIPLTDQTAPPLSVSRDSGVLASQQTSERTVGSQLATIEATSLKKTDSISISSVTNTAGNPVEIQDLTRSRRYALLLIDVSGNSTNSPFCDFELKCTTNNYQNEGLAFYSSSTLNGDPDMGDNPEWTHDWCRIYILSYRVSQDVRRWRRIRNTVDLVDYKPKAFAVIVDTSLFRRGQGSSWFNEANDNIIWSVLRVSISGVETDDNGTTSLWRPVMPIRWYSSLPEWANQPSWRQ